MESDAEELQRYRLEHLRRLMSEISEREAFAGWLIGLERRLWLECFEPLAIEAKARHEAPWQHHGATFYSDEGERESLRRLAELTGHWHTFEGPVPLDEFRARMASKYAHESEF